jgi:hypothetical protein
MEGRQSSHRAGKVLPVRKYQIPARHTYVLTTVSLTTDRLPTGTSRHTTCTAVAVGYGYEYSTMLEHACRGRPTQLFARDHERSVRVSASKMILGQESAHNIHDAVNARDGGFFWVNRRNEKVLTVSRIADDESHGRRGPNTSPLRTSSTVERITSSPCCLSTMPQWRQESKGRTENLVGQMTFVYGCSPW